MPRDARLSRPESYIDDTQLKFYRNNNIDYGDAFKSKPNEPPFTINRFDESDLRRKLSSKKPILNPRLNFVGGDPQQFELFTGLPRFDTYKTELYDFDQGRPNTKQLFTTYPEYKPMWAELYRVSPTLDKASRNPMPRVKNPDPMNRIQGRAEAAAENKMQNNLSVAQLLQGEGKKEVARGKEESANPEQQAEKNQKDKKQEDKKA
tara:strand:- start:740 stop:1357 length:618 start_codon:yes stop_codon:yes gene_type:complete